MKNPSIESMSRKTKNQNLHKHFPLSHLRSDKKKGKYKFFVSRKYSLAFLLQINFNLINHNSDIINDI